jgi:hypothetical protein
VTAAKMSTEGSLEYGLRILAAIIARRILADMADPDASLCISTDSAGSGSGSKSNVHQKGLLKDAGFPRIDAQRR